MLALWACLTFRARLWYPTILISTYRLARNETGMAHVSMIHHCLAVKQTHNPYLNFNYDDINDESILLCNLMTELQFSFVAEEIITNVPG